MPYKEVKIMELKEILRRLKAGQSINKISVNTGRDRKTIRKYITLLHHSGIKLSEVDLNDHNLIAVISEILQQTKRKAEKQEIFLPFKAEINDLLNNPKHKLKLKSVYEVICKRHDLHEISSYSSFKRFARNNQLKEKSRDITCRIESAPGNQLQVDYGKMGILYAWLTGKKRTVYAFIGTLSYSRHKYVELSINRIRKVLFSHI